MCVCVCVCVRVSVFNHYTGNIIFNGFNIAWLINFNHFMFKLCFIHLFQWKTMHWLINKVQLLGEFKAAKFMGQSLVQLYCQFLFVYITCPTIVRDRAFCLCLVTCVPLLLVYLNHGVTFLVSHKATICCVRESLDALESCQLHALKFQEGFSFCRKVNIYHWLYIKDTHSHHDSIHGYVDSCGFCDQKCKYWIKWELKDIMDASGLNCYSKGFLFIIISKSYV